MSLDVVVLGNANNKGTLGGVKSKGGIFSIAIVETSLEICCCCIICEKSSLNVYFRYFGRALLIKGGSSNKGLTLIFSNVLWRISMLGGMIVFEPSKGSFPFFVSKFIIGGIVSSE